ncbi:MAG: DUF938 domain-containing protein [Cyanobacteria bacterium]|nr:DUF938 domain-containing protein [Cyanobacteriota bacterium]
MPSAQVLPFSAACERNKQPILAVLRHWLPLAARVLEIGSGSGQHAVYFCQQLAGLHWQPSDRSAYLPGLGERIAREGGPDPGPANPDWRPLAAGAVLAEPLELDVDCLDHWPQPPFDAVFSANTLHIMPAASVPQLLAGAARSLRAGGVLLLYGPFNDGGVASSSNNVAFDAQLRSLDPAMGIRDAQQIRAEARRLGFEPLADVAMPAHNRTLVFAAADGGSR